MWYVYILKSLVKQIYYKGFTNNIDRRYNQHIDGKCIATKLLRPLILLHVEIVKSRSEARKLEKYFKSGFGREIIKEIDDNLN